MLPPDSYAAGRLAQAAEYELERSVEAKEYNLVSLLRPSVTLDGNQWCVLYGENLAEGIAGFGDTPYQAVWAFNKEWHRKATQEHPLPNQEQPQ